jgi:diaminopimelate epimerase
MKRTFLKMHGLGNDFAIFDTRTQELKVRPEQISLWGDRKRGIGFDQMVIIDKPRSDASDVFIRIYNADGSEVGACGNATRCVASLLIQQMNKAIVRIETKAAMISAWPTGDKITVDMGAVHLDWQDIPLSRAEDTKSLPVVEGVLKNPVAVNVGNPHAVFFVEDVMGVPLETLGVKIEHHPLFPECVNVEIAQVLSPAEIRMRVWERGVGITEACGTGACAAAIAGVRRGLTQRKSSVILDGGTLEIEWRESDNHVLMTGDVALVYCGEMAISE